MSTHATRLKKIFEIHGGGIAIDQMSRYWFQLIEGESPPLSYTTHDELMRALVELSQTGIIRLDGATLTLKG